VYCGVSKKGRKESSRIHDGKLYIGVPRGGSNWARIGKISSWGKRGKKLAASNADTGKQGGKTVNNQYFGGGERFSSSIPLPRTGAGNDSRVGGWGKSGRKDGTSTVSKRRRRGIEVGGK